MQFVVGLDISTCNHQLFRPNKYLQDVVFKLADVSTGDSRISGARGAAPLTEGRDKTFPVGQFSSADRE